MHTKTIDQWLREDPDVYANIGIPTYKAHRHLLIQVWSGDQFLRSGSRKMFDVVDLFPGVDGKLTKKQFEQIKDDVIDLVTK